MSINNDHQTPTESRKKIEGIVTDILKKVVQTGAQTVSTTEENFRAMVTEKLPKEIVNHWLQMAKGSKDEVYTRIFAEARTIASKMNLKEDLLDILSSIEIDFKTQIKFNRRTARPTSGKRTKTQK